MTRGSEEPRELSEPKRRLLRRVAIAFTVPAIGMFVLIMLFVARAELAHDETSCPFVEVETRDVAPGVRVREERRSCQPGIEERRWVAVRAGRDDRELGRRRLAADRYAERNYRWRAALTGGQVHVEIENDDVEPARFREGP